MEFLDFLYKVWMVAGVFGFSASVGWLVYRWQKLGKAKKDHEVVEMRKKMRTAGVACLIFFVILVSFILYSVLAKKAAA